MNAPKVSENQLAVLRYIDHKGGEHVYVGALVIADRTPLHGMFLHEAERAVAGLAKRGIVQKHYAFYTLTESARAALAYQG